MGKNFSMDRQKFKEVEFNFKKKKSHEPHPDSLEGQIKAQEERKKKEALRKKKEREKEEERKKQNSAPQFVPPWRINP